MNIAILEKNFRLRSDGQNAARRTFVSGAVKGIDAQKKTIRAYASTNAWDRYGERFEADAFKEGLANFKKNPVILFAHDYAREPIAKAVGYEFDDKGLILTMKFADTEDANRIFALYEGGFMSAFSVGFRPLEYRFEKRNAESDDMGAVFVRAELLENSAVPVPANPEAVVIKGLSGKSMTLSKEALVEIFASAYRIDKAVEAEPAAVEPPEPEAPAAPVPAPEEAPAPPPAAPAEPEAPAEAPKSLKAALGALIQMGKVARADGKVQDEAVRSLLVQANNLCRELVYGVASESLDGMDNAPTAAEIESLVREYEVLVAAAEKGGKASAKDIEELAKLGQDIEKIINGEKI